ncbi:unnamed protein product [Cochlearia groenlandica]
MAAQISASNASGSASVVSASLYVGDLHPCVTEAILYDAFAEFKSLTSVRLCKDVSTGLSLCYGYANFLSRQDAILAIEEKNHSLLNGKMIRVMWSFRGNEARRNGVGNVFVKNLPESIDNAGLQDMFKKFGNIVSSKVATSDDGKSRGYGFVQYEEDGSAQAAIENLNGTIVADKEIYVGKFMKKTDRVKPEVKYTNLYMKNLDADVNEELLREKFSEFGEIVSLAIAKDEHGSCKGFAFVNYENPEDARRAAETMNGTQFGSKTLYVGRAQKKAEREQLLKQQFEDKCKEQMMKAKVSNVYVKNIDDGVTEKLLRENFSQCGTVTSVKIMCDEKGISKGFGFVCFSTPEEAIKAVKNHHGSMLHGKPLYVAIAQRKEDRKMQLQVQFGKYVEATRGSSSLGPVMPGTYPSLHYTDLRSAMVYQSLAPAWNPTNNLINSSTPNFQAVPYPAMVAANARRQNNRGRLNVNAVSYVPHMMYQSAQMLPLSRDFSNQLRNKPYGRGKHVNRREQCETHLLSRKSRLPRLAAKITGMLLEMDNSELLVLLKSPEHLFVKVKEALEVLKSTKTNVAGPNTRRSDFSASGVSV